MELDDAVAAITSNGRWDPTPIELADFIDIGVQDTWLIGLASGRRLEGDPTSRWISHLRNQRLRIRSTEDLRVGMRLPVPMGINSFGDRGTADQGYLIGQLLGDGSLTGTSVKWCGHLDAATDEMRRIVEGLGDDLSLWNVQEHNGLHEYGIVNRERSNRAAGSVLSMVRAEGLWGSKGAHKHLRRMDYSEEFFTRLLEGIIDSDGCVGDRAVDITTISEPLMRQLQDVLQRLSIQSRLSSRRNNGEFGANPSPLWSLLIKGRDDVIRLRSLVRLRSRNTKGIPKDQLLSELTEIKRSKHGRRANDGNPYTGGDLQRVAWDRIVSIDPLDSRQRYRLASRPNDLVIRHGILALRG